MELETAYGIGQDGLNNSFKKDFMACLEEELFFPTLKFCSYSFLDLG